MTLGGQVHHGVRLMLGKDPIQLGTVADIHLFKGVALAAGYIPQRLQIACIGQFIEIDHGVLGMANDMAHNGRADKACATGNENFHEVRCSCEVAEC